MRRVSILVGLVIIGLLVALGGGAPWAQQPPQKVVFALNWFPVGDHAAYWVALEKGYYRQRGLDVDMQNSKGSGDSIAKVDTGRAAVGQAGGGAAGFHPGERIPRALGVLQGLG